MPIRFADPRLEPAIAAYVAQARSQGVAISTDAARLHAQMFLEHARNELVRHPIQARQLAQAVANPAVAATHGELLAVTGANIVDSVNGLLLGAARDAATTEVGGVSGVLVGHALETLAGGGSFDKSWASAMALEGFVRLAAPGTADDGRFRDLWDMTGLPDPHKISDAELAAKLDPGSVVVKAFTLLSASGTRTAEENQAALANLQTSLLDGIAGLLGEAPAQIRQLAGMADTAAKRQGLLENQAQMARRLAEFEGGIACVRALGVLVGASAEANKAADTACCLLQGGLAIAALCGGPFSFAAAGALMGSVGGLASIWGQKSDGQEAQWRAVFKALRAIQAQVVELREQVAELAATLDRLEASLDESLARLDDGVVLAGRLVIELRDDIARYGLATLASIAEVAAHETTSDIKAEMTAAEQGLVLAATQGDPVKQIQIGAAVVHAADGARRALDLAAAARLGTFTGKTEAGAMGEPRLAAILMARPDAWMAHIGHLPEIFGRLDIPFAAGEPPNPGLLLLASAWYRKFLALGFNADQLLITETAPGGLASLRALTGELAAVLAATCLPSFLEEVAERLTAACLDYRTAVLNLAGVQAAQACPCAGAAQLAPFIIGRKNTGDLGPVELLRLLAGRWPGPIATTGQHRQGIELGKGRQADLYVGSYGENPYNVLEHRFTNRREERERIYPLPREPRVIGLQLDRPAAGRIEDLVWPWPGDGPGMLELIKSRATSDTLTGHVLTLARTIKVALYETYPATKNTPRTGSFVIRQDWTPKPPIAYQVTVDVGAKVTGEQLRRTPATARLLDGAKAEFLAALRAVLNPKRPGGAVGGLTIRIRPGVNARGVEIDGIRLAGAAALDALRARFVASCRGHAALRDCLAEIVFWRNALVLVAQIQHAGRIHDNVGLVQALASMPDLKALREEVESAGRPGSGWPLLLDQLANALAALTAALGWLDQPAVPGGRATRRAMLDSFGFGPGLLEREAEQQLQAARDITIFRLRGVAREPASEPDLVPEAVDA